MRGERRVKRLLVNHLQRVSVWFLKRLVNERVEMGVEMLVIGHLTRDVG